MKVIQENRCNATEGNLEIKLVAIQLHSVRIPNVFVEINAVVRLYLFWPIKYVYIKGEFSVAPF